MNPYRQNNKTEEIIFKRTWLKRNLRKFKIKLLVLWRGKLKKIICQRCKAFSLIRLFDVKSSVDHVYYWNCKKCKQINWLGRCDHLD